MSERDGIRIGQEDADRDRRIFERGRASAALPSPGPLILALELVETEVLRALNRYPSFNSPHEGKAVIEEELDELWAEIKANRGRNESALNEAKQVAAMSVRYMLDCCEIGSP